MRTDSTLNWYDIRDLGILSKGWQEVGCDFERLPAKAESLVSKIMCFLSHNTLGLNEQFIINASEIYARWSLIDTTPALPHMLVTVVSELDLYLKPK